MTLNLNAARFYPRQLGILTITVGGNWGTLTVDKVTGRVLSLEEDEQAHADEPNEVGYRDIVKVDLAEFYATYGNDDPSEHIDILDVGFWFTDGFGGVGYEAPDGDWREGIANDPELMMHPSAPSVIQLGAH